MKTMESASEAYRQACAEYVPDASDNPECVPFYRAWRGVKAAWGTGFVEANHHWVHRALCWSSPEYEYETVLKTIRFLANDAKRPDDPYRELSYHCPPHEPTEDDVIHFFRMEYRRAYPGKRVNSKHAKEQWAKVKDRAAQLVREQYEKDLEEYRAKEAAIKARNDAQQAEWQAQVDAIEAFKAACANLPE